MHDMTILHGVAPGGIHFLADANADRHCCRFRQRGPVLCSLCSLKSFLHFLRLEPSTSEWITLTQLPPTARRLCDCAAVRRRHEP